MHVESRENEISYKAVKPWLETLCYQNILTFCANLHGKPLPCMQRVLQDTIALNSYLGIALSKNVLQIVFFKLTREANQRANIVDAFRNFALVPKFFAPIEHWRKWSQKIFQRVGRICFSFEFFTAVGEI